jgi:hypothetical protein
MKYRYASNINIYSGDGLYGHAYGVQSLVGSRSWPKCLNRRALNAESGRGPKREIEEVKNTS